MPLDAWLVITLYYDASGLLIAPLYQDGRSANGPDSGSVAGGAGSVTFDETTNAALLVDLNAAWGHYTVSAGALLKDGVTVTIAAPSATTTQNQQVQDQAQQVVNDITTYLGLSSPTNAQTLALIRELARYVRYDIHHTILDPH